MKIAMFSAKPYDKTFFNIANENFNFDIDYLESKLDVRTASLVQNADTVCCFVSDCVDAEVIAILAKQGVKHIALRSAGFNHVDLKAAKSHQLIVSRVPAYSPYAVAEHAVALVLTLNRKIHRAYYRVRENDYSLHGLMGFDLHGTTVGVIGTGKIGSVFCKIMQGFGCKLIAYDPVQHPNCIERGVKYLTLDELLSQSDIISLHCPLTPDTHHMINTEAIAKMKKGVMLINTSRGATIDTKALIPALKNQTIGFLGLDVYEEEADVFYQDLSDEIIQDDTLSRLHTFPNVVMTSHQAFFTRNAMANIAKTTLNNINAARTGQGEIALL